MLRTLFFTLTLLLAAQAQEAAEADSEVPEEGAVAPSCSAEQCQAVVDLLPDWLAPYAGCSDECVVMVPLVGYEDGKPAVIAVKDGELHEASQTQDAGSLRLGRKIDVERQKRPSFIRIGKRPSFIRIGRSTVSRLLRLGKRPSFIRIGK